VGWECARGCACATCPGKTEKDNAEALRTLRRRRERPRKGREKNNAEDTEGTEKGRATNRGNLTAIEDEELSRRRAGTRTAPLETKGAAPAFMLPSILLFVGRAGIVQEGGRVFGDGCVAGCGCCGFRVVREGAEFGPDCVGGEAGTDQGALEGCESALI
jgi:hypothetical protein